MTRLPSNDRPERKIACAFTCLFVTTTASAANSRKSPFWCVCQSSPRPHLWWSFFFQFLFFRFWIESILCFSFCLFVTSIAQSIHVSPNGRWSIRAMLRIQKRQQLKFLGFLRELPDGDAMQNYSVSFIAFARPPSGDRSVGRRNKATTNCELFYFHFTHFAAAAVEFVEYANHIWSILLCYFALSPLASHTHVKFNGHNSQQWAD